jgi:hypothetical protein
MSSDNLSHPNLVTALAAAQTEIPTITKSDTAKVQMKSGGTYQYKYATLADIHTSVLPILARHGLAWITMPTLRPDGHGYVLVCELAHASGESRTCEMPLPVEAGAKELGSAITYMRRYAICAVCGIATDEDDDGAAAPAAVAAPQQQRPAPQDHAPAARTRRQQPTKTAQPQEIIEILREAFRQSDRDWHVKTWATAPRSAALPTELLTKSDWRLLRAAGGEQLLRAVGTDLTRVLTLGDALTAIGLAVKSTGRAVAELVAPDHVVEEMDWAEAAAEGQ